MKVRVEDSTHAPLRPEVEAHIGVPLLNSIRGTYMGYVPGPSDPDLHPIQPLLVLTHDREKNRVTADLHAQMVSLISALEWRNQNSLNDLWSNAMRGMHSVMEAWAKDEPCKLMIDQQGITRVQGS